ncbi:hypothetical protein M0802_001524 [Mischocyttarus mexicanus]|nr:hypothetical protein M0802_001524 [Mischocyttarus mexicanus]
MRSRSDNSHIEYYTVQELLICTHIAKPAGVSVIDRFLVDYNEIVASICPLTIEEMGDNGNEVKRTMRRGDSQF